MGPDNGFCVKSGPAGNSFSLALHSRLFPTGPSENIVPAVGLSLSRVPGTRIPGRVLVPSMVRTAISKGRAPPRVLSLPLRI